MTHHPPRHAISLIPDYGTTGIGSLPHTQLELALQMALQADIPYLPQLPRANPGEWMISSALEGLPGLTFDDSGICEVSLQAWNRGHAEFKGRLDSALKSGDLTSFLPAPQACRAWKPFLWEVATRKLALAKVQIAGPFTVRWSARTDQGEAIAEHAGLDQTTFRLLLAKGLAMVKALKAAGATPLIFLDEPGLIAFEVAKPSHLAALQELKLLTLALQNAGALVGLHCCGNTHWAEILRLGFNIISLDAQVSLENVLVQENAVNHFLAGEGTFSLGIIPTDREETVPPLKVLERVAQRFSNTSRLPVLLTPACGLGMRSIPDAENIVQEVKNAQRYLRKAAMPPVTSG